MLRDLLLLPVYDSAEYDLVRDLQVPLLRNSSDYLRGVGFFTSGWLRIASSGLADFVSRHGKVRFVVSPSLESKDWDALQHGEEAKIDPFLLSILQNQVLELKRSLETDTLNALAWMIADGFIEFRFAIPRSPECKGNYHDKVGVFTDVNGDSVAVHGSLNDSIQGSLNGEAFSVFKSWDEGQSPYLKKHTIRLEALWHNHNSQFTVRKIPDAIKEQLIELRSSNDPPYSRPMLLKTDNGPGIHCPVHLHEFQETALSQWEQAGFRGVFEMATGTGKTITSLAAAVNRYHDLGKLAVIVLVPYLHLLDQWGKVSREFGFTPILCSSKHGKWQINVSACIQDFNLGTKNHICILAVHKTAASVSFHKAINQLRSDTTMLIGDEVHGLGSKSLRKALISNASMRLGLSATPRRWFDEEGTAVIFTYFAQTCFEYTLEQAIGKYLTPYRYYPNLVNLTSDESDSYEALSAQITSLMPQTEKDQEAAEQVKYLLIKRARIISSAENKIPVLLSVLQNIINDDRTKQRMTRDILIYCAPGSHKEVLKAVSVLGLHCHEFVHDVSISDREKLLKQFANGVIQVLVAIRCLDEGVDVPSTRTAFILASSTNPREFVQRRGRILRLYEGKSSAIIHDFIVVPTQENMPLKRNVDASILKREMPRFVEFSSAALNEFDARSTIHDIIDHYELINLLDEKPWDIYNNNRECIWENNE